MELLGGLGRSMALNQQRGWRIVLCEINYRNSIPVASYSCHYNQNLRFIWLKNYG